VPPPAPPVAREANYSDWTFFAHGDDYRGALLDFREVAGPIPMIPRSALGIWFARYFPYSAAGFEEIAEGYRNHGLPLDVLRIDMDWHLAAEHGNPEPVGCFHASRGMNAGCAAGWGGYAWDRALFPDPEGFAAWAKSQNISTILNVHDQCGIDMCQEGYAQAIRKFPQLSPNHTVGCQFESEAYASLRQYLLSESDDHKGIDWWWSDMGGVPDVHGHDQWQCGMDTPSAGFSSAPIPHYVNIPSDAGFIYGECHTPSVLWTNYVGHSAAIVAKKQRGFRLGINGGIGSHRYPQVGSGDVEASWVMLSYIVHQTLTASNVALSWFHELGAFYAMPPFAACNEAAVAKSKELGQIGCNHVLCLQPDPNGSIIPGGANDTSCVKTPELYTRWSQFAVFHSIYSGTVEGFENRPWKYPQSANGYGYPTIKQTILLRHALTAYHYTAMHEQVRKTPRWLKSWANFSRF
jgi:alpha-glucosidase (family GH31 glycosyl hydrolase)